MDTTDQFLRFAAECEVMARFTRNPENKAIGTDWPSAGCAAPSCWIANTPARSAPLRPGGSGTTSKAPCIDRGSPQPLTLGSRTRPLPVAESCHNLRATFVLPLSGVRA